MLLGPGPSEANARVLKAMTTPMLGYLDTKFVEVMDDTVALLRQVFGTKNRLTLPVSGTGTAGMEAALTNVIEPGDGVVVGINGYFGERIANIATRCGGVVTTVEAEWGTHIRAEKIAEAVAKGFCTETGCIGACRDLYRYPSTLGRCNRDRTQQ